MLLTTAKVYSRSFVRLANAFSQKRSRAKKHPLDKDLPLRYNLECEFDFDFMAHRHSTRASFSQGETSIWHL